MRASVANFLNAPRAAEKCPRHSRTEGMKSGRRLEAAGHPLLDQ
jgi:hypothetical protein